jgi:hypothetical protein
MGRRPLGETPLILLAANALVWFVIAQGWP